MRFGTDNRNTAVRAPEPGNTSPVVSYTNQYTRAADDTVVFPAQNLGLSWAAFMMGIPTSFSIDDFVAPDLQSAFFSVYGQDTWRVNRNLTLNFGLRWEYENGIPEADSRHRRVGPRRVSHHLPGRNGVCGQPQSEPAGQHLPVRGGPMFAIDPAHERPLVGGAADVDAARRGAYRRGTVPSSRGATACSTTR